MTLGELTRIHQAQKKMQNAWNIVYKLSKSVDGLSPVLSAIEDAQTAINEVMGSTH